MHVDDIVTDVKVYITGVNQGTIGPIGFGADDEGGNVFINTHQCVSANILDEGSLMRDFLMTVNYGDVRNGKAQVRDITHEWSFKDDCFVPLKKPQNMGARLKEARGEPLKLPASSKRQEAMEAEDREEIINTRKDTLVALINLKESAEDIKGKMSDILKKMDLVGDDLEESEGRLKDFIDKLNVEIEESLDV